MDTIRFEIENHVFEESDQCVPTVAIYVNSRNLADQIIDLERRYWLYPEHNPEWAAISLYMGINLETYPDITNRFANVIPSRYREPTLIYTCVCQMIGCNRIEAMIDINNEVVTWSDIRSPELGGSDMPIWVDGHSGSEEWVWHPIDYSSLGPFVFDTAPYMQEVKRLVREWKRRTGAGRC